MSNLIDHVKSIADDITNPERIDAEVWEDGQGPNACDYCRDVLDVEYIVGSDNSFKGARLLVTCGGPNIWIDTRSQRVEGHWWGAQSTWYYLDNLGLHEFWEEMYACR